MIPDVKYSLGSSEMSDLFRNFTVNWDTLSPALWVLYGVLAGFFILKIVKKLHD